MSTSRSRTGARRGLTLIEVLIVIAILLAIGGLVVVNLMPRKAEADVKLTRVQIQQLEATLDLFKLAFDRYPTEDEGLAALWNKEVIEDEDEAKKWGPDPYLKDALPRDKWGSEWIYRYPGEIRGEQFFDIVSIGPDREEGTGDDITNHDHVLNAEGEVGDEFDTFTPADDGGSGGGRRGG